MSTKDQILQRRADNLQAAWAGLLAQPVGRLLVSDLLDQCQLFTTSETSGRSVGLYIMDRITANGGQRFAEIIDDHQEFLALLDAAHDEELSDDGYSDA